MHCFFFHFQNSPTEVSMSQLQHGLVRWVQNYGEHILKTLIARSPKLPHPRRYSNSMLPPGGATASPLNGHSNSNGAASGGGIGGRPPRPPSMGRATKFGGREGMLGPPSHLPTAPFRPPTYPILGSPTSMYYGMGMVPALPGIGQMSPTGGASSTGTGAGGSATTAATGYPTVGGIPNVNQGLIVQVPPLAAMSAMGVPTLDSSTVAAAAAATVQQHQQQQQQQQHMQQQPSQGMLYMQPVGLQQHPQHQQLHHQQQQQQQQQQHFVSLSGSPIQVNQQQEFTHPSSPVGFKAPVVAMAGERVGGGGGGGGMEGEESAPFVGGSYQQPQQQQAHLVQTQGLVTMTPIMAPSASPSSSLNFGHGTHHLQQLTSHQQQQLQQQQQQLHAQQQQQATSLSSVFEHLQQHLQQNSQQQQVVRPTATLPAVPVSNVYQEPSIPPQPLMAQFHHHGVTTASGEGIAGGHGVSAVGTTGTGTSNLPLMAAPPPLPVRPLPGGGGGGGVAMGSGHRSESEPLLPNPPIPPIHPAKHVTSVAAGGGGASSSGHGSGNQYRKEIPCKHFLAGTCPFGEKCWFAHLEPILSQQREGTGGSRFQSQVNSASSSPLHVQIPHNLWVNNPNMFVDLSRFTVASPPQSPLNSTIISGTRPPILPTLVRPRAYYPNFPGQQPLLLVRPPGTVFPAGVQGVGGYPFFHTAQYPSLQPQVNPILKFNLLSEVVIKQQVENKEMIVTNITKMVTRADHFYVAYGQLIHDYKILFGGNRPFQESSVLIERKVISEAVSCLHLSKQQPTLMIIGTVFGSVYTWDIRKGAPGGVVTSAHKAEVHFLIVVAMIQHTCTCTCISIVSVHCMHVIMGLTLTHQ